MLAVVLYRINAGGGEIADSPAWSSDSNASPSAYSNLDEGGNSSTSSTAATIDMTSPSIPAGAPMALFQSERFDKSGGANLLWDFPVTPGQHEVRLYFAETFSGAQSPGVRVFSVQIEGVTVLDQYDVYADVGGYKGVVKSFTVTSDANLDIDFQRVLQNPSVKAIEIISLDDDPPPQEISFSKSTLGNTPGLSRPTSVQFGPDGRLYVAQQDGLLRAYTVSRNGSNQYEVATQETISLIQQIPNHDDNGALNASINTRLVTGLLVAGTAQNPVLYVTSSDPRIGGGSSGADLNLDTNSSMVSRLTWNGSSWEKLDLVRGLPRSEENHAANGMQLNAATNTLYVAMGGNTNMGAPSNNFSLLPEFALSAAILAIDLNAIGNTTYDLPTLDDETRSGVTDSNDPFGGNDGKNQAKLVPGGPVQIYAPGFRNPYDLVLTSSGRMYTVDNGSNAGWGDVPVGEGTGGNATNGVNEPGVTHGDSLHFVTGPGYYGGHPNPTRSNPANTFNSSNPQSPVTTGNAVESDYRIPGAENGALAVFPASTNGITEYVAGTFGGAMQGDLIIASFDNSIKRIKLSADGTQVVLSENLFSNVGFRPLDVTAPATGAFAGSIWVVDIATQAVYVFEPATGLGGDPDDFDGDGYSNDDEAANGTNPHNAADVPPDFDADFLSDRLDENDDNDSLNDPADAFAIDPSNGANTPVDTLYSWENEGADAGGILGLGFTGLMANGVANYDSLYDPLAVTAGGAAGVFTIDSAWSGSARGSANSQQQAFQFGVNVGGRTQPYSAVTSLVAPFNGLTPQAGQEMGFYLGTGDQDNYLQIVVTGNGGGSIETLLEVGGEANALASVPLSLSSAAVSLKLLVNPTTRSVQPQYSLDGVNFINVGAAATVPAAWIATTMAVGLISVNPAGTAMPVTWDYLGVVPEQPSVVISDSAAKIEIYPQGSLTNSSTARVDSFRIYNNSASGQRITSVLIDLGAALLPDMLFDPNGTAGDVAGVPFTPGTGGAATGQSLHSFLAPRDGGFGQLSIGFDDFNPGETFTFRVDVDPTSVKGSAQPGPSNAADVSGLELAGATITVQFSDGSTLSGQVFALAEGASYYKVSSDVTLTNDPVAPAPQLSLLEVGAGPAIVQSAAQTIRVSGPVGAAVRLLQTEVALHLNGVPGGGYDIDPYETNKVVFVRDDVAVIGAGGFVDIPVTLRDSLVEGGVNYFAAVLDLPGGRTSGMSNVVKVAHQNLPPGSVPDDPPPPPPPPPPPTEQIVYRVDAGGPQQAGSPAWSADTSAAASPYNNSGVATSNSSASSTTSAINTSHSSIPAGTPAAIFQTYRADAAGGTELEWNFPVAPGDYVVRLYFAEIWSGAFSAGARKFDVTIEGAVVLDNYDVYADVGALTGVVKSFTVTADANLDIDFLHVAKAPIISAIEIVSIGAAQAASLMATPLLAGDYNADGAVDGADFLTWQRLFGSTSQPPGGVVEGEVDRDELDAWAVEFGEVDARLVTAPEPVVVALAAEEPLSVMAASADGSEGSAATPWYGRLSSGRESIVLSPAIEPTPSGGRRSLPRSRDAAADEALASAVAWRRVEWAESSIVLQARPVAGDAKVDAVFDKEFVDRFDAEAWESLGTSAGGLQRGLAAPLR